MDENPERRMFLDKLLGYMDEIRKPVTACPTISKQPLDLYRLYLYVKERGGFMEVCKVNFTSQIGSSKSNISSSHTQKFPFLSPCFRLPKVRHGKMSPVYWVLELAAAQHTL